MTFSKLVGYNQNDLSRENNTIITNNINLFTKLEFNLDDKSKASIKQAQQNYINTVNSLQMHVYINDVLTKGFCKTHRISPDSVLQLGMFGIARNL